MSDAGWSERLGRALRLSEQRLDPTTLARLRAARSRAVLAARPPPRGLRWWLPAALAAGLLLAWLRQAPAPRAPVNVAAVESLEMLTDELGPEFYEALDLYLWLEGRAPDG